MTGLLPEAEGWIKLVGAMVAILMAILVPVRSWVIEDRRYRAQTLEAVSAASHRTLAGVVGPSTALADTLTITRLAEALDRVAAAVEHLITAESDRDRDRLTQALERFLARQGESPAGFGPAQAARGPAVSAPASSAATAQPVRPARSGG